MDIVKRINNDYYVRIYRGKLHTENGINYGLCQKCKQNDMCRVSSSRGGDPNLWCKSNIISNLHILNVPFYLASELPRPREKICYFCLNCINLINEFHNPGSNSDLYLCLGNSTYKVNTFNIIN